MAGLECVLWYNVSWITKGPVVNLMLSNDISSYVRGAVCTLFTVRHLFTEKPNRAKTTMEEFSSRFYSLSGATVGEKRKQLFLLLNRSQQAGSAELNFSSLQPRMSLEENFKVEALIYFKRVPELVEVLKSENVVLIERIMKIGAWFWEEAFQDVTGEQLVTQLFPYVSFNVKTKIVNHLALHLKNTQRADTFFEAIDRKYGIYLASKLLSACSIDVIIKYIKADRITPTPRQLLIILKNNPEVTEDVLKALKTNNVDVAKVYKNTFSYLAKYDAILFQKLYSLYEIQVRLGWRTTNKFVHANRQQVVNNPNLYYKYLHNKQIAKSLQNDFKECYFNLFPSDIDNFYNSHRQLLSIVEGLPNRMKDVHLYLAGYERAYGTPLWQNSFYVTPNVIKMLTPDERQNVSKPDHISEEEWSCYWKTEKSLPYLKKKILLTSDIKSRADLIKLLVKTCALNADTAALKHICKYVLSKHRNDSIAVRLAFLKTLQREFNVENLSEEHWALIHEMLDIFTLNNETFYDSEFDEGYIHFCFKNGLPVKDQIAAWVKSNCYKLNIMTDNPEFEKRCLMMTGEIIPQVLSEKQLINMSIRFLFALVNWNERHPKDAISLFIYPNAISCLKQELAEDNFFQDIKCFIKYYSQQKNVTNEQAVLLNLCLRHFKFVDRRVIKSLMQFELSAIIENIDIITQRVLKLESSSFFWKYCINHLPLEMLQRVIEIVKAYQKDAHDLVVINTVVALSYLMSKEEFLAFIAHYCPENIQIDSASKEARKIYKIQQKICHCLRNIRPSSVALNNLMLFCKRSSTMLIQHSLYSLCSNINEDKLIPFIGTLATRPALIRKHTIHLTMGLLDSQHKYNMLHHFMDNEKKTSVLMFLFRTVFNFFIKNPDDISWELVKSNVTKLNVNDKKVFDILMQIEKIPPGYTIQYVIFAWHILNTLSSTDDAIASKKASMLDTLSYEIVQSLPTDFCVTLIKAFLFKYDDTAEFHTAIQSFTCKYIIYCKPQVQQEEHLKLVFEILKNYITEKWHTADVRATSHKCVAHFIVKFCNYFLKDKSLNNSSLVTFFNLWNNFLKPHEAFNEYLHLQFTLICSERLSLIETTQKIEKLCNHLTESYGPTLISMFCDKLNYFLDSFLVDIEGDLKENRYVFIQNFVHSNSSNIILVLVILLININRPDTARSEEIYNRIIEMLSKRSDPVILLYLDQHFRRN